MSEGKTELLPIYSHPSTLVLGLCAIHRFRRLPSGKTFVRGYHDIYTVRRTGVRKHVLTLTIVLGRFLKNSLGFSTTGRGGSFRSSCSTVVAARFFESFLLFPSPSAENSPTDTRVTKLFMCGGPLSLMTCGNTQKTLKHGRALDVFLRRGSSLTSAS